MTSRSNPHQPSDTGHPEEEKNHSDTLHLSTAGAVRRRHLHLVNIQ